MSSTERGAEARADRRVLLIAVAIMLGLVLFGVGFASQFGATACRRLDAEVDVTRRAAVLGDAARTLLVGTALGADGVDAAEALLGPVAAAVTLPLGSPLRIGPAPVGLGSVVVTGDGAVVVDTAGDVTTSATFRDDVTVVGDGVAVFALVVGNERTGQVDALRPLVVGADGFDAGTCVDTSAVGSPLSFLHDARGGRMLGLRTDEDGSEAVLELRDHVRGRVWAPPLTLPRAPAGLQGARTSGAIGPGTVVLARRLAEQVPGVAADEGEDAAAVRAYGLTDGTTRWEVGPDVVRGALPATLAPSPTLRLEVAHVDDTRALVTVHPDVPADAPLPLPTFGPLGALASPDPATVTLTLDVADGTLLDVAAGPAPVGREGVAREALLADLAAAGVAVDDVLADAGGTWLLADGVLARLGTAG